MHNSSFHSDLPKEYCLLCDLTYYRVIAVQFITPSQRIPINHHSAMKRQNRLWLTISEYCRLFGNSADSALCDYSPHLTVSHIYTVNEKLAAKYGYPHEA